MAYPAVAITPVTNRMGPRIRYRSETYARHKLTRAYEVNVCSRFWLKGSVLTHERDGIRRNGHQLCPHRRVPHSINNGGHARSNQVLASTHLNPEINSQESKPEQGNSTKEQRNAQQHDMGCLECAENPRPRERFMRSRIVPIEPEHLGHRLGLRRRQRLDLMRRSRHNKERKDAKYGRKNTLL